MSISIRCADAELIHTQQINMLFTWLLALLHMSTKQFPNYTTKQSIPIWSNACSLAYNNKLIITSGKKHLKRLMWHENYIDKNDFVFSFRQMLRNDVGVLLELLHLTTIPLNICVPSFFRWLNEYWKPCQNSPLNEANPFGSFVSTLRFMDFVRIYELRDTAKEKIAIIPPLDDSNSHTPFNTKVLLPTIFLQQNRLALQHNSFRSFHLFKMNWIELNGLLKSVEICNFAMNFA